jgi:hypothetical protein
VKPSVGGGKNYLLNQIKLLYFVFLLTFFTFLLYKCFYFCRRAGPRKGRDTNLELSISFFEAVNGCKRDLEVDYMARTSNRQGKDAKVRKTRKVTQLLSFFFSSFFFFPSFMRKIKSINVYPIG